MKLKQHLSVSIFAACVALIPLAVTDPYYLSILVFIGIYSLSTTGLNLLMGYAGQISLGHAAFYAIGAYTSGILTTHYHLHMLIAFPVAILMAAVIAYIIGVPCLRLKGHYLAMGTLAFGEIAYIVLNASVDFTGGPSGIYGIPQLQIGGILFDTDLKYYYLVWIVFFLFFIISRNIVNSRTGRALRSIHGSEMAANAMGVNVSGLKVKVFILSAVFAAVSGILYAHFVTFISPQTSDVVFSIRLLTMVVVGGMGHLWGGVLGAGVLTLLAEFLRIFEDYEVMIYGLILLVVVMYLPGGLMRGMEVLIHQIKKNKKHGA